MNWDTFFREINDLESFQLAITNLGDYVQKGLRVTYQNSIDGGIKLHYNKRSGDIFLIEYEGAIFYIDRLFLAYFSADFRNQIQFELARPNIPYFSFVFMLHLRLSRDALSGHDQYVESLLLLDKTSSKGPICIENTLIESRNELNSYLSSVLSNFAGNVAKELEGIGYNYKHILGNL